jgi:hypothetical protein
MATRPKTKKEPNETGMLAALKFVSLAQKEIGAPYQTHCRFGKINETNFVVAFDGVIAAGHPVDEELQLCPHTKRLIDALGKAKGAVSLTALDSNQLIVKTDKFRASISCLGFGDLTYSYPDPPSFPFSNEFIKAASIAGIFNKDGAQTVMAASVLTKDFSVVGTNNQVVIEAWHGVATPPGLVIPIGFIEQVEKTGMKITHFGFSDNSFTVHFENKAWIKTQLYMERYPSVDMVLAFTETAIYTPLDKELIEAVKAVASFAEASRVWIDEGVVRSHEATEIGASYICKSALTKVGINSKFFLALSDLIEQIDLSGNDKVICFAGKNMRGAMSKF